MEKDRRPKGEGEKRKTLLNTLTKLNSWESLEQTPLCNFFLYSFLTRMSKEYWHQ